MFYMGFFVVIVTNLMDKRIQLTVPYKLSDSAILVLVSAFRLWFSGNLCDTALTCKVELGSTPTVYL